MQQLVANRALSGAQRERHDDKRDRLGRSTRLATLPRPSRRRSQAAAAPFGPHGCASAPQNVRQGQRPWRRARMQWHLTQQGEKGARDAAALVSACSHPCVSAVQSDGAVWPQAPRSSSRRRAGVCRATSRWRRPVGCPRPVDASLSFRCSPCNYAGLAKRQSVRQRDRRMRRPSGQSRRPPEAAWPGQSMSRGVSMGLGGARLAAPRARLAANSLQLTASSFATYS